MMVVYQKNMKQHTFFLIQTSRRDYNLIAKPFVWKSVDTYQEPELNSTARQRFEQRRKQWVRDFVGLDFDLFRLCQGEVFALSLSLSPGPLSLPWGDSFLFLLKHKTWMA